MKEFMYDINSVLIASVLFVLMILAIELGYRIGFRVLDTTSDSSKSHINAIQGSLLGVLALLLGFTFSLSLERYDSRSSAVVEEANAIGTTFLRSQLLVPEVSGQAQQLLRKYVDVRMQASSITMIDLVVREGLLNEARALQNELWALAGKAVEVDDRPVTTGLFIQALNDLIDNLETRDSALNRHVPELVLILLFGTFLMTGTIVGFSAGVSGHRTSFTTYIMVILLVLLVFMVLDLDRPRRGMIEVSQKAMIDLQKSLVVPR